MKFSASLVAFAAFASVVAATNLTSNPRDTSESGLALLGKRSHERKARHIAVARNKLAEQEKDNFETRDFVSKWGKLTWYDKEQLNNPACGGLRPSDTDFAVAVKAHSGYGECGDTVHIHYNGKMVSAKVVDFCEGCEWGHYDATKAVFSKLAPLSAGVLEGIHFKLIQKKH